MRSGSYAESAQQKKDTKICPGEGAEGKDVPVEQFVGAEIMIRGEENCGRANDPDIQPAAADAQRVLEHQAQHTEEYETKDQFFINSGPQGHNERVLHS